MGHALLFVGQGQSGLVEAALELAKTLFCRSKNKKNACGLCRDCRRVTQNSHPDLWIIETEEDSAVIKIEQIRELKSRSAMTPFEASTKIFIINGAERLNEMAQNALLKTLEEPEAHNLFVLITSSPERLLATIRSRMQMFHIAPREHPSEIADDPIRMLAQEALAQKALTPDFLSQPREVIVRVLDYLMNYFREVLMLRIGADSLVDSEEYRTEKEKFAVLWDEKEITRRIELLAEFKKKLAENVNLKLAMGVLWKNII